MKSFLGRVFEYTIVMLIAFVGSYMFMMCLGIVYDIVTKSAN